MSGKDRYRRTKSSQISRKEDRVLTFSGVLGITTNGENQVEVPGRPGYVWVQLRNQLNETIQAFNESVSPVFDLPVLVEWDKDSPIRYKVRGRDVGRYTIWLSTNAAGDTVQDTSPYLPAHGASHSFNKLTGVGGGDVVWVYGDQFIPWLVTPSGSSGALSVSMQPGAYFYDQEFRWAGGTGIAGFDTLRPTGSSSARMLLVYLDPDTGNPYLATGTLTEFANTITGSAQIMPYVPPLIEPTDIPLAGVRLITGTSRLLWQNLYDFRDYFAHSSVSGTTGYGGAPTDAQYVVMALNGDLSAERVLTAGSDVTLTDGGAGGNATVGVATGTFSRAGHGHLYPYSVAIYDDHVFQATGTILDFTGNIDVAVTGTSVFISSTATGGGGSTVLIYDDSTFKVTGSAISFDDNLTVHVTGSTAYVVGQAGGAGGFPIISEDSVFKATGVAIDFGENMNVAVTGTTVYVSSVDTTSGGGGSDLLIYDNGAFKVTGTSIDFESGLTVDVTGSSAFVNSAFSTPVGIGARVYNDSDITVTGSANQILTFNSERWDTDSIHDTGSNTSRLTCQTAGKYIITGLVQFAINGTGVRQIWVILNGSTDIGRVTSTPNASAGPDRINITTIYDLAVGDYVELSVYQDSGGNLSVNSVGNRSPEFMMQLIEVGDQDNTLQIYDDSVFVATGTAISFDDNLDVTVTGSVAYINNALYTEEWQSFAGSSTVVGWLSFTTQKLQYKTIGNLVFIEYYLEGPATGTTASFTLPHSNSSIVVSMFSRCLDVGTWKSGFSQLPVSSNTVGIYSNIAKSWSGSTGTRNVQGEFFYESA